MSKGLIESAERLLTSMLDEATAGEAVEINPETGEAKVTRKAVPFNERMRLVGVATSFMEAKAKLLPEGENEPSQFERDTAHARNPSQRRAGRRKKNQDQNQEADDSGELPGAGNDPAGRGYVFDPLAATPDERDLTTRTAARGPATDLNHTGVAGSAD
jgi:hypothetical protein